MKVELSQESVYKILQFGCGKHLGLMYKGPENSKKVVIKEEGILSTTDMMHGDIQVSNLKSQVCTILYFGEKALT